MTDTPVSSAAAGERRPTPAGKAPLGTLVRLLRFVLPYKLQLAGALAALVVAAAAFLVIGQGLRRVIDEGFVASNPQALNQALAWLLAIVAVMAAAVFARFYLVSWIGERVVNDVRRAVYSHLLRLSPRFFEEARTGEMISRLTADTALLETVVGTSVSMAIRNTLMGAGALVMLAATSPRLTALVLLGVPLVVGPIVMFGRRVRRLSRASQDRVADLGSYVDETLHEIRTVQAYGHEAADRRAFGGRIEAAFATAVERIRLRSALVAAVILLTFGAVGVILWIGGHDVLAGRITAGQLSAFVFYAVVVAGAAGAISEVIGDLQRGAGATERLMEILRTEPDIQAPARPLALPEPPVGRVELERVTFFYPSRPGQAALDDVSLAVAPGEKLALVGPSGAGKSTLFQLLLRFYDPAAGAVRIDGVDLRLADPVEVRARLAVVLQEAAIFAASVAENVRYARPDAGPDEVRRACEAAHAAEFIERLPEGYDTFLGERGVRLSGGQRQRIAIARAILADRPVLLLDEATSALDSESERMVQAALARLMAGRTSLVIAHRLSTVMNADRIVVLDRGRVAGAGTHAELLRASPLYARLAELQFGAAG